MFQFKPRTECQEIKAIVFLIKSTEQERDRHIKYEQYELAAEAQEQLKQLKQTLFDILLKDRFTVSQMNDGTILIKSSELKK
jgi:spermidine/putrescine-binding protein